MSFFNIKINEKEGSNNEMFEPSFYFYKINILIYVRLHKISATIRMAETINFHRGEILRAFSIRLYEIPWGKPLNFFKHNIKSLERIIA